jgi:hypothetical protein
MKMIFIPPFVYAHRVYLEKGEMEIPFAAIRAQFGPGGDATGGIENRWVKAMDRADQLKRTAKIGTGVYYGFRTADESMLFYMQYSGTRR